MPFVLIIGIGLVLTAFVSYAQALLAHSTNTAIVGWLTNILNNVPLVGSLTVPQILKLDAWVTHQLGTHFKQVENHAVGWIAGLSTYSKIVAAAGLNLAAVQWAFAAWVVRTAIPKHTKAAVAPVARTAGRALAVARSAEEGVYNLSRGHRTTVKPSTITRIEHVAMPHAEEWTWINHHWGALVKAVTAPVTLPGVVAVPEVTKLWGWTRRNLRWHNRRIARLEALLGVGVFAATMAKVLGVSAKCLGRSGNVGKTARRLCGLPTHFLDDVLGLLADFLIIENICMVLPWLEAGVSEIAKPLVIGLTDIGAGLCHSTDGPAKPLAVPQLYLPSAVVSLTAGV